MLPLKKRCLELDTSEQHSGEPARERNADLALVECVQRGERAAFDLLVLKYQARIAKVVRRYVPDPHEASDVVQETFLRAYRAVSGFRGNSAFYTWLHSIALNTAKNHARSARRRSARSVDIGADRAEDWPSIPDIETPEELASAGELRDAVDRAVAALPEEMRAALVLREVAGLSYAQIAEITDCPIGTVRSRIFRARQAVDLRIEPLLRTSRE